MDMEKSACLCLTDKFGKVISNRRFLFDRRRLWFNYLKSSFTWIEKLIFNVSFSLFLILLFFEFCIYGNLSFFNRMVLVDMIELRLCELTKRDIMRYFILFLNFRQFLQYFFNFYFYIPLFMSKTRYFSLLLTNLLII